MLMPPTTHNRLYAETIFYSPTQLSLQFFFTGLEDIALVELGTWDPKVLYIVLHSNSNSVCEYANFQLSL